MKAETLPAVHQADLAQASGKGALRGFTDTVVVELVNALNALSVGAQEAQQGSGVQDMELAQVLVNLQIVPGQPAHKAAIDAVQIWTGLEEQVDFAAALLQDSHDELMATVSKAHVVEDPYDDELNDGEDVESTGAGAGGGGGRCRYHRTQKFRLSLALWSISPNHVAMAKQETFCVRRRCRSSETLPLNQSAAGRHQGICVGLVRTQYSSSSRIILYHTAQQ